MNTDETIIKKSDVYTKETEPDETVLFQSEEYELSINVLDNDKIIGSYSFSKNFTVGREANNSIFIDSKKISRRHAEIKKENGGWWLYDLNSANGLYLDDVKIAGKTKLNFPAFVGLGNSGFQLQIEEIKPKIEKEVEQPKSTIDNTFTTKQLTDKEAIKKRLLSENQTEDAGEYTQFVRTLIHDDRQTRSKSYKKVIWGLVFLFFAAISLIGYQHTALNNAQTFAIDMFYDIKTLEVSLSQADMRLEESANALEHTMQAISNEKWHVAQYQLLEQQAKIAAEKERMLEERNRLAAMKVKYQQYVQEANALKIRFPTSVRYEEELIAKVARELGESELELPDDFVDEVKKYIGYWQNSSRMQKAIMTLEQNGYAPIILSALQKEGLPPYLMYIPLQESNFDTRAIGPETRFGIAKGAWQFLASTGQDYGLSAGPLANTRDFDELDGRFDFAKATVAGAKYLKRMYSTEAQASGLLVIAGYNYGDNRVKNMIQKMPDNPRDRNFWKFTQQYTIPKETYDYVFYIFSAAVIGEDPQHFGFKFKPPL